jgi:serine/threonine protein kinase/Flp pilus assembly protein TadD
MSSESKEPQGPAGKPEPATTVTYRQIVPQMRADRYSVERFHARGGIGEIWLAEDREINRQVALKRLRPDHLDSQDRFVAEAQVTGQLEHPAIVPVHDFGLDEAGQPFYVMKLIHGRTLKDAVEQYHSPSGPSGSDREVEWLRLLEVFVDVCQAVAFAHSRGVLHRDLKPDNVMLGAYGETVLLDWGLAKVLSQPEGEAPGGPSYVRLTRSGGSSETQAGSVLGAPAYMAPEVAEGRASEVDETTDVYLLGGCLYHILSHAEMVELARTVDAVPPRERKKGVPRPLEAVCLKAMSRRKQDRYQTAQELAEDVQRYLAGEPVSAYREGLLARMWRWGKRHRRGLTGSAVTALILGLTAFGFAKLREAEALRARELAHQQVVEFRNLAGQMRFYAASTNPSDQRAPYYDLGKAERVAQAALAISQDWGPTLEDLPLPNEHGSLKQEIYELLLLRVQARQQPSLPPDQSKALLAMLEQARLLAKPSRSYYRLKAGLFELLDDRVKASEASRHAKDPQTPTTALDHFLLGEQYRTRATPESEAQPDRFGEEPDVTLLEKAVEEYRAALEIDPDHYWSHFQLGRCYLALHREAEAVQALTTCIALRPEVPWAYSARGLTLALLGRFSEAMGDLDLAVSEHRDFRPARLNRGVALSLQRKYERALADFDAVLRPPLEKRLIEAAYYRGQIYLRRRQFAQAVDDFDRVIAEQRDFRPVYTARALAHFLLKDDQAALKDLTELVALRVGADFDPESTQAYHERGRLLRRLSSRLSGATRKRVLTLAAAQLEKAADLGEPSAERFYELGSVRDGLEQKPEAIELYSQGLDLDPNHVQLRINRGAAVVISLQELQQKKKVPAEVAEQEYKKARADFAGVVRREPENPDAHAWLGYVQACLNELAGAREQAIQALLLGAGDYLVLHQTAGVYVELEDKSLAMAVLTRAVQLWRRGGRGPSEIEMIKKDRALDPLRGRPDYQRLINDSGPDTEKGQ